MEKGALADTGDGLKWGKKSTQGHAILPLDTISHHLLLDELAVPFQNKFLALFFFSGV